MKITLFEIPEGVTREQLATQPERWGSLKKLPGQATFNAGGKSRATGLQISRVVWDVREDLRSAYFRSLVTETEDAWQKACYRIHEMEKCSLSAPIFLDDPEQWDKFYPRIGYSYQAKEVNPHTGKRDIFTIFGQSDRKMWWVSTWNHDTLSWGYTTSAYPGTLGPWYPHGGLSIGEVFCRESMGSYTFWQAVSDQPTLECKARYDLPSFQWRDEELRQKILETLAWANGYLWLKDGFCPFCAAEDAQSELERRFDEYVHCPTCKRNADELAQLAGTPFEECDQCRGEPVLGRDGEGDYDYCEACSGRGYWVTDPKEPQEGQTK